METMRGGKFEGNGDLGKLGWNKQGKQEEQKERR